MGPKTYKFSIVTRPSVIGTGELFKPQTVFMAQLDADGSIDAGAFAEKLFFFWKQSNILGDATEMWEYECIIEQV